MRAIAYATLRSKFCSRIMVQPADRTPNYGNWVSKSFVCYPFLVGLISLVFALLSHFVLILSAFCFLISGYFMYARFALGPQGGDVQTKVRTLVLSEVDRDGRGTALDIGCGSGALAIMLTKEYPDAKIIGIDSWGKNWEYSKETCEQNARIQSVDDRVEFSKASASSLPFPDEYFDLVVSNLTFHEVREASDKLELLKEAIRVTKKNSGFVFQDLFLFKSVYGDTGVLIKTVNDWGLQEVRFLPTHDSAFVPRLLKLPFMLGTIGIIVGRK